MKNINLLILIIIGILIMSAGKKNIMSQTPCIYLHSPYQCITFPTGQCFWDISIGKCKNYYNNEDMCIFIHEPKACINSSHNCLWDMDKHQCHSLFNKTLI